MDVKLKLVQLVQVLFSFLSENIVSLLVRSFSVTNFAYKYHYSLKRQSSERNNVFKMRSNLHLKIALHFLKCGVVKFFCRAAFIAANCINCNSL